MIANDLYDDFVAVGKGKILGYIRPSSKKKLSILNFEENGENRFILHDIVNKTRVVVYGNRTDYQGIFFLDGIVYAYLSDGKLFELRDLPLR